MSDKDKCPPPEYGNPTRSKKKKPVAKKIPRARNPSAPDYFELPHMFRIIGPKHIKIMKLFMPSAIYYSAAYIIAIPYFCEWKSVLQYLPYWNGKYVTEDNSNKDAKPDADE